MTYHDEDEDQQIEALIVLTRIIVTYDQDLHDRRARIRICKPDKHGRMFFETLEITATLIDWRAGIARLLERIEKTPVDEPLPFSIPCS